MSANPRREQIVKWSKITHVLLILLGSGIYFVFLYTRGENRIDILIVYFNLILLLPVLATQYKERKWPFKPK